MRTPSITYGKDTRFSFAPEPENGAKPQYPRHALQLARDLKGSGAALVHPRPGMSLFLFDYHLGKDLVMPCTTDGGTVSIVTVLSGRSGNRNTKKNDGQHWNQTKSCDMVFKPRPSAGEISLQAGRHRMVSIRIDEDRFRELLQSDPRFGHLLRSLDRERGVQFMGLRPSSPQTQMIASQILDCGLRGLCRDLFLEGKSLELFAAILGGLDRDHQRAAVPLSRSDVERLHEARRILFERMADPPGLWELGRMVGLNEFKLKQGFRQVFGCTAFAALRDHRLHVARAMLLDSDTTVAQVSATVGYTNMGHFIARFRARFGVTPGSLLSHARRNGQTYG